MSGKILIVDDLATNRIIVKAQLTAAFHQCLQASDGCTALEIARREQPAAILLDVMLPDITGIEVCRRLRADPVTQHLPIIMITASGDRQKKLEALAVGADDYLSKPLNSAILLARIRSLLRAREAETELRLRADTCRALGFNEAPEGFHAPGRIGLIAHDLAQAIGWRAHLTPHTHHLMQVLSPAAALAETAGRDAAHPPRDLYMIAVDPCATGASLRLVADLRARPSSRHSAIALVLPETASESAADALDIGANDLLPTAFDPQEIALRLDMHIKRKRRSDRLRQVVHQGLEMAVIDPLTGLYNRRYALAHLERIVQHATETGKTCAVMVLDLDRFKAINDRHGHNAGDQVLREVGARLRGALRAADLLARIGGEEFLVVLPDVAPEVAQEIAQRLCLAVAATPIALEEEQQGISVTVSVGLATGSASISPAPQQPAGAFPCPGDPFPAAMTPLLRQADLALLSAKARGRNQVTVYSGMPTLASDRPARADRRVVRAGHDDPGARQSVMR
ncbi:MAG: diguanylate cyclase [Pararhodobacter sp.]|nr:diguanylate cyclase [Pararhodobacter sp.]